MLEDLFPRFTLIPPGALIYSWYLKGGHLSCLQFSSFKTPNFTRSIGSLVLFYAFCFPSYFNVSVRNTCACMAQIVGQVTSVNDLLNWPLILQMRHRNIREIYIKAVAFFLYHTLLLAITKVERLVFLKRAES